MGIETALVGTEVLMTGAKMRTERKAARWKASGERAANTIRMNQMETATRNQKMDQIERARAIRAQAINIAEQTGMAANSATQGAVGGIQTAAAVNIAQSESNLQVAQGLTALGQTVSDRVGALSQDAALFDVGANVVGAVNTVKGNYGKAFDQLTDSVGGLFQQNTATRPDPWN